MNSKNNNNLSFEELYKLIVDEPESGENTWQTKAIRLLALNNLMILQKLDKLDFKVKIILYLFMGMFILLLTTLFNIVYKV